MLKTLRHVVKRASLHLADLVKDVRDLLFAGQVELVRFDNEERRGLEVEEKIVKGFNQVSQVFLGDVFLPGASFFGDSLEERGKRNLKVDRQVRPRNPLCQNGVDSLVDDKLVVAERLVSVDFILLKEVIADHPLLKQVSLGEPKLLVVAVNKENKLGQKRGSFLLVVKIFEIRILRLVEDNLSSDDLGQNLSKLALLAPRRTLDGDMAKGNLAFIHPYSGQPQKRLLNTR